jgi:trimethylamine--corrinoid protein Co-methyltransferase
MEAGLANSPEMIVFTVEIISMLRRFQNGFLIDGENLGLEVINAVGPGGNFLTEDHTVRHFREYWQSVLFTRQRFDAWHGDGAKTLGQRVRERTICLLDEAAGTPLSDSLVNEVHYILDIPGEPVSRFEQ